MEIHEENITFIYINDETLDSVNTSTKESLSTIQPTDFNFVTIAKEVELTTSISEVESYLKPDFTLLSTASSLKTTDSEEGSEIVDSKNSNYNQRNNTMKESQPINCRLIIKLIL